MKVLIALTLAMTLPLSALHGQAPAKAKTQRAVFSQHCFWTGEMEFGRIDGVVRTEAGFFKGHEVTSVEYDPARISLEDLAAQAKRAGVAESLHLPAGSGSGAATIAGVKLGATLDATYRIAPADDQKKQIQGTPYAGLRLTPEEATKVNAFVRVDPAKALQSLGPASRAQLAATH